MKMTTQSIEEQARNLRLSDGDLQEEFQPSNGNPTTEETTLNATNNPHPYRFVPLKMGGRGGTHIVSEGSRSLILEEVTLKDLTTMTELFYEKAFQDATLDQFIRSHDDPHGARFAKWRSPLPAITLAIRLFGASD